MEHDVRRHSVEISTLPELADQLEWLEAAMRADQAAGKRLFALGRIGAMPGAAAAMQAMAIDPVALLRRHLQRDWGDAEPRDAEENAFSIQCANAGRTLAGAYDDAKEGRIGCVNMLRIKSAYRMPAGVTIWVLTEFDHSATTFLLRGELWR